MRELYSVTNGLHDLGGRALRIDRLRQHPHELGELLVAPYGGVQSPLPVPRSVDELDDFPQHRVSEPLLEPLRLDHPVKLVRGDPVPLILLAIARAQPLKQRRLAGLGGLPLPEQSLASLGAGGAPLVRLEARYGTVRCPALRALVPTVGLVADAALGYHLSSIGGRHAPPAGSPERC